MPLVRLGRLDLKGFPASRVSLASLGPSVLLDRRVSREPPASLVLSAHMAPPAFLATMEPTAPPASAAINASAVVAALPSPSPRVPPILAPSPAHRGRWRSVVAFNLTLRIA